MITQSEMTRVRRQMQRRIRVLLAQRRLDAPAPAQDRGPATGGPPASGEPPPED